MSKPTKYQRWWMGEMLANNGALEWWLEDEDGTQTRGWLFGFKGFDQKPILGRSVYSAINNSWLRCSHDGDVLSLTPAGKRELEG